MTVVNAVIAVTVVTVVRSLLSPARGIPAFGHKSYVLSPRAIRASRGFTLIELIITVAIVAILASAALPLTQIALQRGKEQEMRTALRQIREAIDAYKQSADEGRVTRAADASGYPPSLDALVLGVDDAKLPVKKSIYFLRRLPRDPFAPENLPAAETWGKRSYESPPDNPREGKDVFDIHSLAEGKGLNGVPYKDW
ncbi:MAG TPA: type II secretion system protein [Burkholderiales bacterium]